MDALVIDWNTLTTAQLIGFGRLDHSLLSQQRSFQMTTSRKIFVIISCWRKWLGYDLAMPVCLCWEQKIVLQEINNTKNGMFRDFRKRLNENNSGVAKP